MPRPASARSLPWLFPALALCACSGEHHVSNFTPLDVVSERLAEGAVLGAAPVEGHHVYVASPDGVALRIEGAASTQALAGGGYELIAATRAPDGTPLVITEEGLMAHTGDQLIPSPVGQALSGVPTGVAAWAEALWISSTDGLYVWIDNTVVGIDQDGQPLRAPMAVGAQRKGEPVTWVSHGEGLLALSSELSPVGTSPVVASDLGAEASGHLWGVEEGAALRISPRGRTERFTFPEPVLEVSTWPAAPGAWLRTESRLVYVDTELNFGEVPRPPVDLSSARMASDELGRLLLWGGEGLHRLTLGRVVAVVGLMDGGQIEGSATATLWPTLPDQVEEVVASVDGAPIPVSRDAQGWSLTLSAATWYGAERVLTAEARYADGQIGLSRPLAFSVADLGEVTWQAAVEPLHQQRCATCHNGATETVLNTQQLWIERFDDIYEQTSTGRMPLGAEPLTAGELAVLAAWREGGFP